MPESTLTFPFVDLGSRLRPDRLERLARGNRETEPAHVHRSIIEEIADWLFRAQDATENGGLAGFYHLQSGWLPLDIETTGAAMTTLLSLANVLPGQNTTDRIIRLSQAIAERGAAFDQSSQKLIRSADIAAQAWAILGWIALYEQSAQPGFKKTAKIAGKRLIKFFLDRGSDGRITLPHKAVAAWALWRLFRLQPHESLRVVAESLGRSVAGNSAPDGYLQGCIDSNGADPALIHITRALHGLLEAGLLANRRSWMIAAQHGARRLFEFYRLKGKLAGRYGPDWRPDYSFDCMAGCAQTAVLWLRLYQHGWPNKYYDAAAQLARFISSTVDTTSPDPGIRGGIRAGFPLWVDYHPLAYSVPAAKLALDVFLLKKELSSSRKQIRRLRLKRSAESGHPQGGTP